MKLPATEINVLLLGSGGLMLRSALVLSGQQGLSGERMVMLATLNNLKEWGKPLMALRMHPLCRVLASCAFYCG